jgi:hypothetical protein
VTDGFTVGARVRVINHHKLVGEVGKIIPAGPHQFEDEVTVEFPNGDVCFLRPVNLKIVRLSDNVEVQTGTDGYVFTGEHRVPREGDLYLLHLGTEDIVCRAGNGIASSFDILRPAATPTATILDTIDHLWDPTTRDAHPCAVLCQGAGGSCPCLTEQATEREKTSPDALADTSSFHLFEVLLDASEDAHNSSKQFYNHLIEAGLLHASKQRDYGRLKDPFANVRSSEEWGVKPWVGALIRLNDKVRRLQSLATNGVLANEAAVDSFMDIAVYALIARVLYEQELAEASVGA